MNTGRRVRKTEPGAGRQPRWSSGTGIMEQARPLWVLKGALGLTVVVEPELIDGCVADCPGVSQVPLLKTFAHDGGESRNVCASGLELSKRKDFMMIIEIVVATEVLTVINTMINLYGELIATFGLYRLCLNDIAASRGGDQLQQVHSCGIHAGKWNLLSRKDAGVRGVISNCA